MKQMMITAKSGFQVPIVYDIEKEKTVVLMAHGFGSEKCGHTPLFMMKGLKAAGFGVCGFDFPGHGDSPLTGEGLCVDYCLESQKAAEDFVHNIAPDVDIVYFGSSFGGYITLLYLSMCKEHRGRKVFLRSAAVDMPWLIREFAKIDPDFAQKGYAMMMDYNRPLKLTEAFCEDLEAHDVFRYPIGTEHRIFMVHGEKDEVVSSKEAIRYAKEREIEIVVFPSASHRLMEPGNPEKVLELMVRFFRES